jgi:tripartite-type tricarboxylate transporter receptor subunit TctC
LLLTTTATHAINPALYPSMPYDALKDFTPIALVAITPLMLATSPQLQLKNVQDLIAMAKSRPGDVTYASAGVGTMQHIAGELMAQQAGVSMVHVPYKGTSQVVSDLIAGRVTFMLNSTAAFAALVKEDRLRALAVTSPQRLPGWPNVPTLAESGLPGFEASAWYAIYGPAHVPPDVVKAVNREVVRILQLPATRERYATLGLELPADTSADQLGATTRRDLARWGQLIKAKNIKPE